MKQRNVAVSARKHWIRISNSLWQAAAISMVIVSSATTWAIDIPIAARVRNIGGYCTWASLDTLARANGVGRLRGILQARRATRRTAVDPGYDDVIEAELKARGVRYELRRQFSYDRDLLEQYANSHGVAVSLKSGNPWS